MDRENKYDRFERVLFDMIESKICNTMCYTNKYSSSKQTIKCTKSINACIKQMNWVTITWTNIYIFIIIIKYKTIKIIYHMNNIKYRDW